MYGKPSFYETKTAHAQTIIIPQIGKKELCSIRANQGPENSYKNDFTIGKVGSFGSDGLRTWPDQKGSRF